MAEAPSALRFLSSFPVVSGMEFDEFFPVSGEVVVVESLSEEGGAGGLDCSGKLSGVLGLSRGVWIIWFA